MAGYIPNSGAISIGDAAGSTRSLNALRNIKRSTTTNSAMAMSTLRDWYRCYVDGSGDPSSNLPSSGNQVSFSDFRNITIIGIKVRVTNETDDTYDRTDNAAIKCIGLNGSSDYTFRLIGVEESAHDETQTVEGSSEATFSNLGGTGKHSRGYSYNLYVTDDTTGAQMYLTIKVNVGTSGATVTGNATSGAAAPGGCSGGAVSETAFSSQGQAGSYSSYQSWYIEARDPSGTAYE